MNEADALPKVIAALAKFSPDDEPTAYTLGVQFETSDLAAVEELLGALEGLDADARRRILKTARMFRSELAATGPAVAPERPPETVEKQPRPSTRGAWPGTVILK